MTAYRFVTITCDDCGEVWDEADTNSIREARALAGRRGWTYDHRWASNRRKIHIDLCPAHEDRP